MAYVTQYEIDMQQDARNRAIQKGIGDAVVGGIETFKEDRRRALDQERLAAKAAQDTTLFNAQKEELDYKAKQRGLAPEEQDDVKKMTVIERMKTENEKSLAGVRAKAAEDARIEAEQRLIKRQQDQKKNEQIDSLRKELSGFKPVQDMQLIDSALGKINTAPDSAAGDMSKIFAYMKILDPNSTVREGEYASAEQARGVPEGVLQAYNKAKAGERLSPDQRKDFENAATKLAHSQYRNYKTAVTPHQNRIKEVGIDENQILPRFSNQHVYDKADMQEEAAKKLQGIDMETKKRIYEDLKARQQGAAKWR